MDQKDVSRALRSTLWPALRAAGFSTRTERIAWRHIDGHVDLIEVSALGSLADAVGATACSLGAHAASWPAWLAPDRRVPVRDGKAAPHYWHCRLSKPLPKTLSQPWFQPFTRPPGPAAPASFVAHREGLMRVLPHGVHDRADVWYVLDDGSNLDEVARDLGDVVASAGLPLIDSLHRPADAISLVEAGEFLMRPGSPLAVDVVTQARRAVGST